MKKKVLAFYREYFAEHRKTPTLRVCAEALGISHMTVAHHVEMICRDGNLVRNNRKLYLAKNHKMINVRKNYHVETNQKKAEAGKKVAEMLRSGTSRKGAKTIAQRIEDIVNRAKEEGTIYYPRPKVVVLIGQKQG